MGHTGKGESYRGSVGHEGVGWVMLGGVVWGWDGHVGVGWVMQEWGGVRRVIQRWDGWVI